MATDFTLKRLTQDSPFDTSDLDKRLGEIQKRIEKIQEPEEPTLQQVAPFEVQSMLPTALGILSAAAASRQQDRGGGYRSDSIDGPGTNGLQFGVANPDYMARGSSVLGAVQDRFPGITSGGQFVARNIAGTNTPSEHAYGAAVDLMIPNKALGDKVYNWLLRNQDQYGYSSILWQIPDHYNHIHVGWLY